MTLNELKSEGVGNEWLPEILTDELANRLAAENVWRLRAHTMQTNTGRIAMTDKEWDQIQEVHLKGAFACTKAAWPIFRKQKFGRIVNTASAAGLFGAY